MSKIKNILFHILLGCIFFFYPVLSTYYIWGVLLIGTYFITSKDPTGKYPIIFSLYMVGIEVLLRMSAAKVFWEFGKYAIIYFIILSIITRKNHQIKLYYPILIYFILLLPSIIWVPFESFSDWRQHVAFNLSGPLCLSISVLYLFNYSIKKDELINCLYFGILPLISTAIFVILKMPEITSYTFTPNSDPITSGGYGPNQVSTIFGFGIAALVLGQINNLYLLKNKYFDILCIIIFFALGLITFSRGGILAVLISISVVTSWYFFRNQNNYKFIINIVTTMIATYFAWSIIVALTGNIISERYGFSKSSKEASFLLDLTGRAEIYVIDIQIFMDNFITGIGPGMGYSERKKYGYSKHVAAHTEYSRMLAEHGLLGLISLCILITVACKYFFFDKHLDHKDIILLFGFLALLTFFHSAMRLAMPAFIFGLIFPHYES